MESKTKRLLSVTLAIAMIILSAFSAFAEDTETVVKTVGAMSVAAVSIENDDTTFDVNVKISFNEVVTGPHNIITLTCEKFNLTVDEAAAYFNVGADRIREIADEHKSDMVIMVGVKKLIKRKKMEEYMDKAMVI